MAARSTTSQYHEVVEYSKIIMARDLQDHAKYRCTSWLISRVIAVQVKVDFTPQNSTKKKKSILCNKAKTSYPESKIQNYNGKGSIEPNKTQNIFEFKCRRMMSLKSRCSTVFGIFFDTLEYFALTKHYREAFVNSCTVMARDLKHQ